MQNTESGSRLSLEHIAEAAASIDPVFTHTPQFVSEGLSRRLGCRVLCKVETVNPIRSFKGRGTDYFVSRLSSDDVHLVTASAGNFGQGLAYAARKRGIALTIFAATTASVLKVRRMQELGANVVLHGADLDEAKEEARAWATKRGFQFVEDGFDVAISEGPGSIAVELCAWPEPIDRIVVPVGNGALVSGIGRWMKAHSPQTRITAVAAAGAPAMALSWKSNRVEQTTSVDTIADGIAVRVPVPEAVADVQAVVDDYVLVTDDALLKAMRWCFEDLGVLVEPAGVAGLAALEEMRDLKRTDLVAVPLCGGNLTSAQIAKWITADPVT